MTFDWGVVLLKLKLILDAWGLWPWRAPYKGAFQRNPSHAGIRVRSRMTHMLLKLGLVPSIVLRLLG